MNNSNHAERYRKPMAALVAVGVGSLALSLATLGPAQGAPGDLQPVSIYSLDGGSAADVITSENPDGSATATGEVFGDPKPTADRSGNPDGALLFDGKDDYIQTKEASNKNPLTFSVWFRADDVSGEHSIIDSDQSGKYGHSLIIGYDNPKRKDDTPRDASLDVQYHDDFWDTGQTIEAGTWYQAFVTYSDDTIQLYLGTADTAMKLVDEQPYPTDGKTFDGSNFRFGRHNPGDPQYFKGAMDDIRFYDEALSGAAIVDAGGRRDNATPPDAVTTTTAATTTTEAPTTTTEAPATTTTATSTPSRRSRAIPPASHGDVHIRTPDGLVFDFQEVGDYAAVKSDDFTLQTRQSPYADNPKVSINTGVAMKVGADTLEFSQDPADSLFVNGEVVDFPTGDTDLPGGGKLEVIRPDRKDVAVYLPNGELVARVTMQRSSFIDVGVVRVGDGEYAGLFGNLDDDPDNDIETADGDQIGAPASVEELKSWGDSWLVNDNDSLFRTPNPDQPAQGASQLTVADLPSADVDAAEATCQAAGVTDELALKSCVYDVAATGDEAFVASAQGVQEAQEALPESERGFVEALPSETPSDDDGGFPIVPLIIGLAVIGLIGAVAALVMKNKKPAGPVLPAVPTPAPAPAPVPAPAPALNPTPDQQPAPTAAPSDPPPLTESDAPGDADLSSESVLDDADPAVDVAPDGHGGDGLESSGGSPSDEVPPADPPPLES